MPKRRNYNQDHFKVGGSPQPGDEEVLPREKAKLATERAERTEKPEKTEKAERKSEK